MFGTQKFLNSNIIFTEDLPESRAPETQYYNPMGNKSMVSGLIINPTRDQQRNTFTVDFYKANTWVKSRINTSVGPRQITKCSSSHCTSIGLLCVVDS